MIRGILVLLFAWVLAGCVSTGQLADQDMSALKRSNVAVAFYDDQHILSYRQDTLLIIAVHQSWSHSSYAGKLDLDKPISDIAANALSTAGIKAKALHSLFSPTELETLRSSQRAMFPRHGRDSIALELNPALREALMRAGQDYFVWNTWTQWGKNLNSQPEILTVPEYARTMGFTFLILDTAVRVYDVRTGKMIGAYEPSGPRSPLEPQTEPVGYLESNNFEKFRGLVMEEMTQRFRHQRFLSIFGL